MSWPPVPRGARRWRTVATLASQFCFCFSRAEPPSDFLVWCALPTCPLVRAGSRVSCEWRKSESAFLGTVKKVNDDGSFDVLYDDGGCGDSVCNDFACFLQRPTSRVPDCCRSTRPLCAPPRGCFAHESDSSEHGVGGCSGGGGAVGWHRSVDLPVPLGSIKGRLPFPPCVRVLTRTRPTLFHAHQATWSCPVPGPR